MRLHLKAFRGTAARAARRLRPHRWGLAALALALLVVAVLPGAQIRLGAGQLRGLVGSYLYEVDVPVNRQVQNLRLTDLYLPATARVDWTYQPMGPNPVFEVTRTGGSAAPLDAGGVTDDFYADAFPFQSGVTYTYQVRVTGDEDAPSLGLGAPPAGASAGDVYYRHYASGQPWTSITVTPIQAVVADNQSVDARYDPRYATWVHLDHNFGGTFYRGGLFAGYNADNASVGHAYLNFALPAPPAGKLVWDGVGSVNAYYMRSYAPGSAAVACRSVSSGWTSGTLTWANAPAFSPAGAGPQVTVNYDGTAASAGWVHWELGTDITGLAGTGGAYAAALGGVGEPSTAGDPIGGPASGWAYFSKKEDPLGQPASVLYAFKN